MCVWVRGGALWWYLLSQHHHSPKIIVEYSSFGVHVRWVKTQSRKFSFEIMAYVCWEDLVGLTPGVLYNTTYVLYPNEEMEVPSLGFEPGTSSFKFQCSTTELHVKRHEWQSKNSRFNSMGFFCKDYKSGKFVWPDYALQGRNLHFKIIYSTKDIHVVTLGI
jgi:hypothetical protein